MSGKEYFENMPEDILEYYHIMGITGGLMGVEMYARCQEIINNNPTYFVWEHNYKKIPQSVHDAYLDEKYPDRHKPFELKERVGSCNGLIPDLLAMKGATVNWDNNFKLSDLNKMFKDWDDIEIERCMKEKEAEKLWNKHYSKYKLEYRKGY